MIDLVRLGGLEIDDLSLEGPKKVVLEVERSIVFRNGSPFGRVSSLQTTRMWGRRGKEGKERARERVLA
jgi:hypothetical protein